jgi:hypothetical protein
MPQLDLQSIIIAYRRDITTLSGTEVKYSTARNFLLTQQGVAVSFFHSQDFVPGESISYNFQVAEVSTPTEEDWAYVPPESILPTWNQQYGNILYGISDINLPLTQTAGFVSNGLKWRIEYTAINVLGTKTIQWTQLGITDGTPFTQWSKKVFPLDNNLP